MKAALALLAAAPIVLAQADRIAKPAALDNPAYHPPAEHWTSVEDAVPSAGECRDKIRRVREENGQPTLRRETADPEVPLLIAAVDHRIDGCSVMVMKQDTSDVRPVPEPSDGPVELIPAR